MEANIEKEKIDKIGWHYILIANGFVSIILGIFALIATSVYSEQLYEFIIENSWEKFSLIIKLIVLIYIAYGLVILSFGFIWLSILSKKVSKESCKES